jgi:hypothetical protein
LPFQILVQIPPYDTILQIVWGMYSMLITDQINLYLTFIHCNGVQLDRSYDSSYSRYRLKTKGIFSINSSKLVLYMIDSVQISFSSIDDFQGKKHQRDIHNNKYQI